MSLNSVIVSTLSWILDMLFFLSLKFSRLWKNFVFLSLVDCQVFLDFNAQYSSSHSRRVWRALNVSASF